MVKLTDKQQTVLGILQRSMRQRKPMPTYREIARELGVDVRAAYQHVLLMERKGVLKRAQGNRGIILQPEFRPPMGIPVIGQISAGLPLLAEQNIDNHVDLHHHITDEGVFLLKVRGDSMVDAHILEGDMVLVRPAHSLASGEIGVIQVNGETTVKEVQLQKDSIILISHNRTKAYPDQVYNRNCDVRIIGKVVMAFRFIS